MAREICALPAEAVAISRKLLKLPPEDMTRRIDQESHLFGERMRSKEAVAAFKAFFARKKALGVEHARRSTVIASGQRSNPSRRMKKEWIASSLRSSQ